MARAAGGGRRGAAAGSAIHRGLVGARRLIGTRYLADPALRRAYDDEIAPRTEAALARVLPAVFDPGVHGPVRALDLGAGTGAVGRALRAFFGDGVRLTAVDAVAAPGVTTADLETALPTVDGRFDLVIAAQLLNELYAGRPAGERIELRARRVLAWADALLDADGAVILIEPALRDISRELLGVRDLIMGRGLDVVAPCFWTGPCPALQRERDWCHDAADAGGGRVDFSYLVLRAAAGARAGAPPGQYRVVSDPLRDKGRLRLYVCGDGGRTPLVRLDRHASPANAAFERARRGDVIRVDRPAFARDGLRITPDTTVTA